MSSPGDNIHPFNRAQPVERIGHRGAKREFTENTLPAFARAYERGADAVELDVHGTSDGLVVVHHDPWVGANRLTAPRIAELDARELAAIDLGGRVRIPSLVDVLAATPPKATVYVEIKGAAIEQAVVDVIRASTTRCAVHSFNHDAIARIRELAPEIPRGVLFENANEDILSVVRRTDARDVWPRWDLIDADLVDRVHRARARVIAWTVNTPDAARRLAALGVDGLCGDDVRLFSELE
jgi:glycerophosphoryl diester phosphodiesterase